jgi:hypothetical protein
VPPRDVVHRIRLLCFSGSHPGIADGDTLTPEEIVDTVLYGVVARPAVTEETGRCASHESGLSITELYAELGGDHESLANHATAAHPRDAAVTTRHAPAERATRQTRESR